ncbi:hypothetical protein [Haladaptatus sp. W1]|uniref:hypothetical protein n=1 Tax=Haladaptatus sp. W1 TaxID=1897478 RepID=UPI001586BDEE|nr:hypothetical protein [Haladaptatus sp. W1]
MEVTKIGSRAMDRDDLLDQLTEDILAYVMHGAFLEREFASAIKPDALDERITEYELLWISPSPSHQTSSNSSSNSLNAFATCRLTPSPSPERDGGRSMERSTGVPPSNPQ